MGKFLAYRKFNYIDAVGIAIFADNVNKGEILVAIVVLSICVLISIVFEKAFLGE